MLVRRIDVIVPIQVLIVTLGKSETVIVIVPIQVPYSYGIRISYIVDLWAVWYGLIWAGRRQILSRYGTVP